MKEIWKESRTVCLGLVILIIISVGGLVYIGANSGRVFSEDLEPFITDRVVEVRIVMSGDDWEKCLLEALKEEYVRADFYFDGELVPDVAVRPKGNSSLNSVYRSGSIRLSFKVDFNFFNTARTFRGLKKLNFNNGFHDPTLIREHLSYEIFDLMGLPTPRTAFVDLWVNDTHMGLYTQVEQVDVNFLARHFSDSTGNLYKPEPPAGYLAWTEDDLKVEPSDEEIMAQINMGGAKLVDIMNALEEGEEAGENGEAENIRADSPVEMQDLIDRMGLRTNEAYPDHAALYEFLEILNNEPDDTFPLAIEKVLDVDQVLRFIAVAGTIGYFDSYLGFGHNYYLYEIDGRFTIIPWDLNGAFGSFSQNMDRESIINCYIDEPTIGPLDERPLIARLLAHEPYRETYHKYLRELIEGPFSPKRMSSRIEEVADLVRPYVYSDELKFYTNKDFERALYEDIPRDGPEGIQPEQEGHLPPTPISPETLTCLQNTFQKEILEELRTRRPRLEELKKLEQCLTREEIKWFLQDQVPRQVPQQGSTYIGLETFVLERTESIIKQLRGELPSHGDGSGNGVSKSGRALPPDVSIGTPPVRPDKTGNPQNIRFDR